MTDSITPTTQAVAPSSASTFSKITGFTNSLATAIDSGGKLIFTVLGCVILGGVIYFAWTQFHHRTGIIAKPQSNVTKDFTKADFTDDEQILEYVNEWLNLQAPYVLSECIPNKTPVKSCLPGTKK